MKAHKNGIENEKNVKIQMKMFELIGEAYHNGKLDDDMNYIEDETDFEDNDLYNEDDDLTHDEEIARQEESWRERLEEAWIDEFEY
jgi:hypothetical protein